MNPPTPSEAAGRIAELLRAYYAPQCLYVAAVLGIADLLAAGDKTADELAAATGVNRDALYRVMRALAADDVFHELPGRRFALTPVGAALRSDVPGTMRPAALLAGEAQYKVWAVFRDVVKHGTTGFARVFRQPLFTFLEEHRDIYALFNEAMENNAWWLRAALVKYCDAKPGERVVDVGGGTGVLVRAVIEATAGVRGVLFDTPRVIEQARAVLAQNPHVSAGNLIFVAGDFRKSVPPGDAMLLASILHMLSDAEALAVLGNCRASLRAGGRILILEHVLGEPNAAEPAKWSDLNMMVMTGGRERTFAQYAALLRQAGFERVELADDPAGVGDGYRIVIGRLAP